MDLLTLSYFFLAFVALLGSVAVVLTRDTVHSALSLIGVMLALAGLFLLMRQEFIAMIQVIVYAGAIMVLFVFVIMLLNLREKETPAWTLRRVRFWGGTLALAFFLITGIGAYQFADLTLPVGAAGAGKRFTVMEIAQVMVTDYLLPFELTAVLLLVAMVGALIMARRLPAEGETPDTGADGRENTAPTRTPEARS